MSHRCKLQYLWFLSLSGCGLAVGDTEFRNLIFTCKQLRYLDISYCRAISSESIKFMAERCLFLKHFVWKGHNNCFNYSIDALVEHCVLLQLLDLSSLSSPTFLGGCLSVIDPLKHFQHLKYIDLSGCDSLTKRGILLLVTSVRTLESFTMCFERPRFVVWLGFTNITDECIIALSLNNPNLKEVYLRGCILVTNNCLIPLSQNCKVLNHVDVSGTSCTPDGYNCFNDRVNQYICTGCNETWV